MRATQPRERIELHLAARMHEEGHGEAPLSRIARIHYAVMASGAAEEAVGEILQHIAGIHDDLALERLHG